MVTFTRIGLVALAALLSSFAPAAALQLDSRSASIAALNSALADMADDYDPEAKRLVNELYRVAWEEIALHFHPPTRQWAGPHSRSYSTLLRESSLSFIQAQTSEAVQFDGIGTHADLEARRLQCPCPEDLESYFRELKAPRQLVRSYSKGDRPVIGTTYLGPEFCLGTVNRGDLWNQRRSLVAYWGNAQAPSYLHLRFLHDGYDFSSAQFFSRQAEGAALVGVVLATDGGDTHVSLDRIKNGTFKAHDLRLRFELGGQAASELVQKPGSLHDTVHIDFANLTLSLSIAYAKFGNHPVRWESGQSDGRAFYDLVFYEGPKRTFDLTTLNHAAVVAGVALGAKDGKAPVVRTEFKDDQLRLRWRDLELALPTHPNTRKNLQAAVE